MQRINITDYNEELFGICSLYELNGPFPGTMTPIRFVTHRTDDRPSNNYNNPCVVPKYGYNYSYVKTLLFGVWDWESFCDVLGYGSIQNLGIYFKNSKCSWLSKHGIEVLTTHLKGIPYRQATGIIGESGDPISDSYNCWHLSDFDFDHPYVFDERKYSGEFFSRSFLTQLRISSCALQGEKMPVNIELVADIE